MLVILLPLEGLGGSEHGESAEGLDGSEEVEQVRDLSDNEGRREDVARGIKDERGRNCGRRAC